MNTGPLTKEERASYVRSIKYLDPKGEVLELNEDLSEFKYSNLIESNEIISPPISDEEIVRAFLVVALVKKYMYPITKIKLETTVSLGGSTGMTQFSPQNDIIVMNQDNTAPYLFFEVKRPQKYTSAMDKAIEEQLIKPVKEVTRFNNSKFLVYASIFTPSFEEDFPIKFVSIDYDKYKTYRNAREIFNAWVRDNRPIAFTDIPINYGEALIVDYVKGSDIDLKDTLNMRDIKSKWRTIWDKIWGGTVEDNRKFGEFNKLLLAKIYDERTKIVGETYDFQIKHISGVPQTPKQVFFQIDTIYKLAFKKYLGKNEDREIKIEGLDNKILDENVVYDIVSTLQDVSLANNVYKNIDILGEFYETVIRDAFKQTKGLYLTSPNIVLTIIASLGIEDVIEKTLLEGNNGDHRFKLPYIIDPSCGTGTFLLWAPKYVTEYVTKNKTRLKQLGDDTDRFITMNFSDDAPNGWARDYIYGIEKEAILATASQINMILHGDGSTNIYNTDGLLNFNRYREELGTIGTNNMLFHDVIKKDSKIYTKDVLEVFDIVISNPPFSATLGDSVGGQIEDTFELVGGDSESLFFERYYQLLKQRGRLGVVLPEAFFSVDEYKRERQFLFKHFNLKAIVSLPNTAFLPHTTTLTSLLFAQKKTNEEEIVYSQLWEKYKDKFKLEFDKLKLLVNQISKTARNKESGFNIKEKLNAIYEQTEIAFDGMVRYPVFTEEFIMDAENWQIIRSKLKSAINSIEDWYIHYKISQEVNVQFKNIRVENIGYKRGKKGTKEKPNDLFTAYIGEGDNRSRILNIEKTTVSINIEDDENTVVGYLRRHILWD